MTEGIAHRPIQELAVVQNVALAAEAMLAAALACGKASDAQRGLPFVGSVIVLPLCFHLRSALALGAIDKKFVLEKILRNHSDLRAGLQSRTVALSQTTFAALDLCLTTGVLALNKLNYDLVAVRKSPVVRHSFTDTKRVVQAAARVGTMFAENSIPRIFRLLGVRL